jgi:hypothetical protein
LELEEIPGRHWVRVHSKSGGRAAATLRTELQAYCHHIILLQYIGLKNYREKLGDAKAIENAGAKAWLLA